MKLWLRLVWALLSWRSRGPLELHQVGKRNFRVWPSDLDIFNHMNNGIYLSLLDLGRFDTLKRSGSWAKAKRAKLHPVVVGETITFRKSLAPWQAFSIETALLGWNDMAFFIQQRFVVAGEIHAEAVVKIRFLKSPRGIPTSEEVIEALGGWNAPTPVLPKWVTEWDAAVALPKGREAAPSVWPGRE